MVNNNLVLNQGIKLKCTKVKIKMKILYYVEIL